MKTLDAKDRQLLNLLQEDAEVSHAEIGALLHLSESSVRRRLEALKQAGVIERQVVLVNHACLPGIEVLVSVRFAKESPDAYQNFRARMLALPEVASCWSTAGEVDFVLLVRAPDLASYEQWGESHLMSLPELARYDSQVIWRVVKNDLRIRF